MYRFWALQLRRRTIPCVSIHERTEQHGKVQPAILGNSAGGVVIVPGPYITQGVHPVFGALAFHSSMSIRSFVDPRISDCFFGDPASQNGQMSTAPSSKPWLSTASMTKEGGGGGEVGLFAPVALNHRPLVSIRSPPLRDEWIDETQHGDTDESKSAADFATQAV